MKYPLGIQDFRSLREDGYVYVDKTADLATATESGKYFFLARPRRFGKSLAVSTLAELHSGDRELFAGLWAHDNWDFAAKHSSVIWMKFASSGFGEDGVATATHRMLDDNAARLGVDLPRVESAGLGYRLGQLIRAAAEVSPSGKTVLLIDEYDKPIVDYLHRDDNMAQAEAHREQLRWFYSPLKDADPYLELVFITGITANSTAGPPAPLSREVSLFSEVNNLVNLSLSPLAATLVGITQQELEDNFGTRLDQLSADRSEVRRWYNGYAFGAATERVYNPWSLLNYLMTGQLDSHWYESGTPYWLVRLMANAGVFEVSGQRRTKEELLSFDLRSLQPIPILFQTGYLTIAEYVREDREYRLEFPSLEVRSAFDVSLLKNKHSAH